MFEEIVLFIDFLMEIIQPSTLLYIAFGFLSFFYKYFCEMVSLQWLKWFSSVNDVFRLTLRD
jgi:hypothetical protein